jgi:hypothetical protein
LSDHQRPDLAGQRGFDSGLRAGLALPDGFNDMVERPQLGADDGQMAVPSTGSMSASGRRFSASATAALADQRLQPGRMVVGTDNTRRDLADGDVENPGRCSPGSSR